MSQQEAINLNLFPICFGQVDEIILIFGTNSVRQSPKQHLAVPLKAIEIADTLTRKLRTEQFSAALPFLTICGEDAVAQERLPVGVERFRLAKVFELRGQNGLDVLRVHCDDFARAQAVALNRPLISSFENSVTKEFNDFLLPD